jgi:hypothetical protein
MRKEVRLKLSEQEYKQIQRAAQKNHIPMSSFVKMTVFNAIGFGEQPKRKNWVRERLNKIYEEEEGRKVPMEKEIFGKEMVIDVHEEEMDLTSLGLTYAAGWIFVDDVEISVDTESREYVAEFKGRFRGTAIKGDKDVEILGPVSGYVTGNVDEPEKWEDWQFDFDTQPKIEERG